MNEFFQRIEKLSPRRLALLAVEQQARLEALERARREPVAIIGMGCRFPGGVDSPESFWSLLANGRDAISEVPFERFDVNALYDPDPEARGKISSRFGGFIRDEDKFDAGFFGISRREAVLMDPQQRLLLETSWEALERAGAAPRNLAGSRMGVFFGLSTADYYQLVMAAGRDAIDGYTATGAAHSIAAGRLAYILGLHGPNIAIDTACSSSLVAVHLACQGLRAGECDMALAGGANLVLSPETTIALSKARMLAPDGRCKAFDAAADGFVRSEGCGVLVLKLLSRAVAERDNILAVVRGSAVNQDGRSSGLTAPNGSAQENVIRQALEAAGAKASEVQYVEAHGTGTSLGDPIEAHALAATLGKGRGPENPLYVGSVKTNIGHPEAAAGVAGIIKTVLSLGHGTIPPHLHFSRLNPHIDLNGAPLSFPVDATPWPRNGRLAGVSSFGFSGTNAHIILEAAPPRNHATEQAGARHTLVASARTPAALRELARRYASYLEVHPEAPLADFCYTADAGRSRFECALAVEAASAGELRGKLAGIADGAEEPRPPEAATPAPPAGGDKIALPTYPFERQRYWVETARREPAAEDVELGFYRIEWERKENDARPSGAELPAMAAICEAVSPQFSPLSLEHGLDRYASLQPELDALSFDYIVRALRTLGWEPSPGDTFSVEELAERLGVRQRYWRSFGRMVEIVAEEGVLERGGAAWRVLRAPVAADPGERLARLHAVYPQFHGELTFVHRCGAELAAVLQGRIDPLNLLFPEGSFDTAEELYEKSAGARVFQTLVQQAVSRAVEQFPAGRKIRILEVGAGTGGTAAYVARILPAERTEYVFTDISPLFAARAERKFKQYPFFRYEVLDIERDPEAQGFPRRGFDIVIAANSLHATADLRQTMGHIVQLLAPSGMFVLLEGTRSERWVDISFGLTDGWWRFTDRDLRSTYPLLSRTGWEKLLGEAGFHEVASLPPDRESQQALLLAHAAAAPGDEKRGWMIVADSGGMAALVSEKLAERGERPVLVRPGDPLPLDGARWRGVLDLAALDAPAEETLAQTDWSGIQLLGCDRALTLARNLASARTGANARLWVVTRGAQRVDGRDGAPAIAAAPVWGLGRTIALEHPDIWGGLVDLSPSGSPSEQAERLVSDLCDPDGEDQIAYREGARYVARLRRRPRPAASPVSFRPDACYLITGGLGGLGLLVARWMAGHGARRLILAGRSGVTRQSQTDALREIERLGVSVRVARTDISDPAQTADLFASIAAEEPPLKGVIHAAAALSRDSVMEMPAGTLRDILLPKVMGTWLLHRHTRELSVDFLCLFSSTASLLGSGGMGHYAAANHFLDAFAQYRRGLGLPAVSIAWGTWDEMRTVSGENRKQYRSLGLLPMPSSQALSALGDLLGSPEASIMAAAVNWRALKAAFEARRKRPLLEAVELESPAPARKPSTPPDSLHWEKMTAADRQNRMASLVWEETRRVLEIEAGTAMELDRGFFEMGMDSLVSVDLKSRLEARVGRALPAMLTFNYPTVRALSARLSEEFAVKAAPANGSAQKASNGHANNGSSGALDDEEVVRLLTEKLRKIRIPGGVPSPR